MRTNYHHDIYSCFDNPGVVDGKDKNKDLCNAFLIFILHNVIIVALEYNARVDSWREGRHVSLVFSQIRIQSNYW